MANALARTAYVNWREGEGLIINLDTYFTGNDVPNKVLVIGIDVPVLADDQPAAIRSKMSAAVSAAATANGFTCAGGNMTLPTFQKG